MKNKRIDVIVKYFFPVTAGIETNIINTYSVLVRYGWDVHIHTSNNTHKEKRVLKKYEIIRGLKVHRYNHGWFGINPAIDFDNTDAICLHNFNIFPHLIVLLKTAIRKLLNKKKYALILTPHGGYTPDWNVFGSVSKVIKKYYHFSIGTLLINYAVDSIRAVSDWERNEILNSGITKDKVFTITNGIENEAFLDVEKKASSKIKEIVKSYGEYIIQVGRIYPIKNYETVIKSLPYIKKEIKFVIVGPDSEDKYYLKKLKKLISNLKLNDRVIFAGVLSGVDKFYVMRKAKIMVHMAFWESFCNVVHEGMSQGLVCIVSDTYALPYLVKDGENGYCLKPKDSKKLVSKINFVLDNYSSNIIKKIRKNNISFGAVETWSNVAKKMNILYSDTLRKI